MARDTLTDLRPHGMRCATQADERPALNPCGARWFFSQRERRGRGGWVGPAFSLCVPSYGAPEPTPELAENVIAEGSARAEKVACRPGDTRCSPVPNWLTAARANRALKGQSRIGSTCRVIIANSGRDPYSVWLDIHTGEGRLRRRRD